MPTALKDAIAAALPLATVVGMSGDEDTPARIDAGGRVVVRSGDPGEPEVDLSPLAYNYDQRISVELAALTESALDDMLGAIGAVIEADRTLGGLCTWVDATAPETEEIYVAGGAPPRGANVIVTASYTTPHPFT
ncbi:hypothetical protein [Sphingomonas bacterium]|uniref:hypothetical protein n=1 Tax=Sphingomonas bacterium TaxID=1895847 RepID=UPI001C2D3E2B|nr:hypothetical protein [Sphingomonas bacterium]